MPHIDEALVWVYRHSDHKRMVAVIVSGTHVATVAMEGSFEAWQTTVMSAVSDAHAPLVEHAERMESSGYSLLIQPSTITLTNMEFGEMAAYDKVKTTLTRRVKGMIKAVR